MFVLDAKVEVWRSINGRIDWYREFEGLHRVTTRSIDENGNKLFVSSGSGLNDFLGRTAICYKAGTIRADKNAPAETVMKEYAEENCGMTADSTVVGRLSQGGLPGFTVETDFGRGKSWYGSKAYENLLEALKDIANDTGVDFQVHSNGLAQWIFRTYINQLGNDRTATNIGADGKNDAGEHVSSGVYFYSIQAGKYTATMKMIVVQ